MSEIPQACATAASESGRPSGMEPTEEAGPLPPAMQRMVAIGLLTLLTVGIISIPPQLPDPARLQLCLKGSPGHSPSLRNVSRAPGSDIFPDTTIPFSRHTLGFTA